MRLAHPESEHKDIFSNVQHEVDTIFGTAATYVYDL